MGWAYADLALAAYGLLAASSGANAWLMPRLRPGPGQADAAVLVPARDEAANLAGLLPQLGGFARTYVFDDDSSDGTGELAASLGARVVRHQGAPPEGWTGKAHACHSLALAAAEDSPARWWLFLDADVRVEPGFAGALAGWAGEHGARWPVLTGFPRTLPGPGLEPAFMAWVWWILLASNPFWIVARTRLGHNRFTNGQFVFWDAGRYLQLTPHQQARSRVLEDVAIGRSLAREGVPVYVAALSEVASVRMYGGLAEAWRGMLKNSSEIGGGWAGSVALALGMAAVGGGWIALEGRMPSAYGLLVLSQLFVCRVTRAPWWTALLMPASLLAGAACVLASAASRRRGAEWKGRRYR